MTLLLHHLCLLHTVLHLITSRSSPNCLLTGHHCLSVCVSVTFVHSVKTNKHIFEIFSPSGSQAILVFPYQTAWQYSDGNTHHGASNAGG